MLWSYDGDGNDDNDGANNNRDGGMVRTSLSELGSAMIVPRISFRVLTLLIQSSVTILSPSPSSRNSHPSCLSWHPVETCLAKILPILLSLIFYHQGAKTTRGGGERNKPSNGSADQGVILFHLFQEIIAFISFVIDLKERAKGRANMQANVLC